MVSAEVGQKREGVWVVLADMKAGADDATCWGNAGVGVTVAVTVWARGRGDALPGPPPPKSPSPPVLP